MSVEDILEDYPSLTRQVDNAISAATLTATDVSYPNRSMKRALIDLVSMGVFDEIPSARRRPHSARTATRRKAGTRFRLAPLRQDGCFDRESYGPLAGEYQIITTKRRPNLLRTKTT
jgi:hypothetical protein